MSPWKRKAVIVVASVLGLVAAVGALWWVVFGLKPYALTPQELQARYALPEARASDLTRPVSAVQGSATPASAPLPAEGGVARDLVLTSFDGARVPGRIVYPAEPSAAREPFPVLIALHGLGRTHLRWWQGELRGRPTIERTDQVTALALQQGFAVVALDARGHGARKGDAPLPSELLENLHLWGQREPYERMIIDTVRDYRVLIDVLAELPRLDRSRIAVTGYSMGAQTALLLAGVDARVQAVAAMVPPHLDSRVAAVAPVLAAPRVSAAPVWLLTADDDAYASARDNAALFAALPADARHRHLRFPGGHVLPQDYVAALLPWLQAVRDAPRSLDYPPFQFG